VLPHLELLFRVLPLFPFQRGQTPPQGVLLIFCNPLDIPVARFTNSSPKAFLSNSSEVLTILGRSCCLVPGFFIRLLPHSCCLRPRFLMPVLHSGPSRTSVHSGFLIPHCPSRMSCDRVPAPCLLYCGSSSCRLRPIPFAIHNFPGSEFA
jgi:hypothetical protein